MPSSAPGRSILLVLALCLAACGGGGSPSSEGEGVVVEPRPTPLPATLSIEAPAVVETGAGATFQTSQPLTGPDLRWSWDFGDGRTSNEARPAHAHATSGRYEVRLQLSNGAGHSVQATRPVLVGYFARLAGRDCSAADLGGWCWLQPARAVRQTLDVQFADPAHGMAVGELGQIATSSDAGRSWALAPVAADGETLQRVRHADSGPIYVVTSPTRRLLRSVDGGISWQVMSILPVDQLIDVWIVGSETVVASGWRQGPPTGHVSVVSVDGGASWRDVALFVSQVSRQGLLFADGGRLLSRDLGASVTEVWACCELTLVSAALRDDARLDLIVRDPGQTALLDRGHRHRGSLDGGRTWSETAVQWPATLPDHQPYSVSLFEGGTGLAVMSRPVLTGQTWTYMDLTVVTTSDGGRSWTVAPVSWQNPAIATAALPSSRALDARSLWAPRFEPASPTGAAAYSIVILDIETGRSSVSRVANEDGPPLSLQRVANGVLLARFGRDFAQVYRWYSSADNGATWTGLPGQGDPHESPFAIRDLWFFDGQHGLALREDGRLLDTADGGATWQSQASGIATGCCTDGLHFVLDGAGWMIAQGQLLRSDDRGRHWQAVSAPPRPVQVQFVDARRGWLVENACVREFGSPPCNFPLHRTTDGGQTWTAMPLTLREDAHLAFADPLHGVAMDGFGALWRSGDGGIGWTLMAPSLAPGGVERIHFDAHGRGWILLRGTRTRVLRSTDFGQSWQAVALPLSDRNDQRTSLHDIRFADARRGWIVGDAGVVLVTDDGGLSWHQQRSGTERGLNALFVLEGRTAWIGGAEATILSTSTGGD